MRAHLFTIFFFFLGTVQLFGQVPRIVPTFHCLGIYWSPPTGSNDMKCHVNYRRTDENSWHSAQNLWFDDRRLDGRPREYRGSIVNLAPGTEYEIQLWLEDENRTEVYARASTWSESFPVQETIYLSSSDKGTTITESGSPSGYVVYTGRPDTSPTIDVRNAEDFCVFIPQGIHHVIIRGLTLKGAARHAIRISDNCHDIVIEDCDISEWGNADSTGYGINLNAAISAPYRADFIERLVIQRNKIHHPRTDSNSWGEPRPNPGGDPYHPQGPYGLVFYDTQGNHVIRYNEFYTDDDHYFCDILGAGSNISYQGFPNKDSDIYGNYFERCWDDAIESEGANENVRIWDNVIDHAYHPIGAIVTSVGPMYIWRNITKHSRKFGNISNSDDYGRGAFIKCGGTIQDGLWYGDGRIYVYHNTILQPLASGIGHLPLGCEGAFVAEGKSLYNMISRNNILTNYDLDLYTIRDNPEHDGECGRNDFDYDLYTGRIDDICPDIIYEQNGIALESNEQIIYNPADPAGPYALMPRTPGHDAGILLPNFNDDYVGEAPDMGAIESKIDSQVDIHNGPANPQGFNLYQNHPNPFNGQTRILFYIPDRAYVELDMFDANGRRVRELMRRVYPQGHTAVLWDGRNDSGRPVASGVYVYRLKVEGKVLTRKLLLLR